MNHGTANAYNNGGCRCDECRTAWATYTRDRRASDRSDGPLSVEKSKGGGRRSITQDGRSSDLSGARRKGEGDEPWHGTVTGYSYRGCRCERCVPANQEYHRHWRRTRGHLLDRGADAHRAVAPVVVAMGLAPTDMRALGLVVNLINPTQVPMLADLAGRRRRKDKRRYRLVAKAERHLAHLKAAGVPALDGELLELVAEQADDDRWASRLAPDRDWFQLGRLDEQDWRDLEDPA